MRGKGQFTAGWILVVVAGLAEANAPDVASTSTSPLTVHQKEAADLVGRLLGQYEKLGEILAGGEDFNGLITLRARVSSTPPCATLTTESMKRVTHARRILLEGEWPELPLIEILPPHNSAGVQSAVNSLMNDCDPIDERPLISDSLEIAQQIIDTKTRILADSLRPLHRALAAQSKAFSLRPPSSLQPGSPARLPPETAQPERPQHFETRSHPTPTPRPQSQPGIHPHYHCYSHKHTHRHTLEDGTLVIHEHVHSHTYEHHGEDQHEQEKRTRITDHSPNGRYRNHHPLEAHREIARKQGLLGRRQGPARVLATGLVGVP